MLKASWLLVGVLAVSLVWHGGAAAQSDALERIDAIYLLSEKDNTAALEQMRQLGDSLGSKAPYAVRRAYLAKRIELELDSAQTDAARASIATLLHLAQAQKDDAGIALATVLDAYILVSAAKLEAALLKLGEALPLAQRAADPEVLWQHYRVQGLAQLALGQFAQALESFLQCQRYADQQTHNAPQSRLRALGELSKVYAAMKNPQKSLAVIDEALVLAKQLDSNKMQATLYLNQGNEFAILGRSKDSIRAYERALKVSRDSVGAFRGHTAQQHRRQQSA
ncbi:MAG: tetratricopeptide repeat protein [Burkholderiales bacterium]|nr:tetratricopeptide repeat protein [Burkholderiales bacterium]